MQPVELYTPETIDPEYGRPVIDQVGDLTHPVPHRKVSGHFEGTDKRFNFYFPPKDQWKGRFFHLVYPTHDEHADDETIRFGADSGAYTVQTNGGLGFRVDAAAAMFSRKVAAEYYGTSERIYGYIWGGSGGSYQTTGAMENSVGIWDGAVPFIPGTLTAIPNDFFCRAFARFVLMDKARPIADAVSPGGSGDPYAVLDEVERAVLQEITKLGVPLRSWEDYRYVLRLDLPPDGLLGFVGSVKAMDPTYAEDFWSKPGYLGTEQSPLGEKFRAARVDQMVVIKAVERNEEHKPISLTLDHAPTDLATIGFEYNLYAADGKTHIGALAGTLDASTKTLALKEGLDASVLQAIEAGCQLRIDNVWLLAVLPYHRYQVPTRQGFYTWDQFRAPDGTPLHPQRPIEVGSMISLGVTGGGTWSGNIRGKVIMVANLLDCDAFPWHADWYRARVREALGDGYEDSFRVWLIDHADHVEPHHPFLINYMSILQQALRDVSAWVEQGVPPARSTRYEVADGQVIVPMDAASRLGIQPVVDLTVNGSDRIEIRAGETVHFEARIQVPPHAGKIIEIAWDYLGTGSFEASKVERPEESMLVRGSHTYTLPGTYMAALRAVSHRDGDVNAAFARIPNLGRVRVVVHAP